ncbi:MAG TPA: nucleotidyltransferase family protein [Clostridia bacterium]|nr:nucleotidyltransferase family protein [Clostridia bacterium]
MNIVGIICEYNPLHNGHKHQIDEIKALFKNDALIVCLLSSNYVQRGEPALVDKYARADMAIESGADMVLEYPTLFCCTSAEAYAQNAIYLLNSIGIIDYISYGSKSVDSNNVKSISSILANEPSQYKIMLKDELSRGLSFPKARENALSEYLENKGYNINSYRQTLQSSNDILAIEYEKALIRQKSQIKTIPIKRVGSDYNDDSLCDTFSSATAIRKTLSENNGYLTKISEQIPITTKRILKEYKKYKCFANIELFKDIISYSIMEKDANELCLYPLVNEGIENLLQKYVTSSSSISTFIDSCVTKRYPSTRIQRLLMHIMLGANKGLYSKYKKPEYIRVLASKNKNLLSLLSNTSNLPVVTSLKKSYDSFDLNKKGLIEFENKACDIYNHVVLKDKNNYKSEFSIKTKI